MAAILAFIIGAMAVFSGMQVLLGKDPGYTVLGWLPVYNYTMGFLTALVTSVLLWTNSKLAVPAAVTTISLHALAMLILQTTFRGIVAAESVEAMTVRLVTWSVIMVLVYVQKRKDSAVEKTTLVAQRN